MGCPYCGGDVIKVGKKNGKQQYKCKSCNKYFYEDVPGFIPPIEKKFQKCIYCGGRTNKSGKTKWGVQIYWCRDCHKRFNENTMPQPPIKERCPYCGGELKYKGWSNNGHNRRYLCKECGKGFSGDLSNLQVRKIEKPCPYCGSEDVKKGGHLRSGARRYVCNSCGKGYNENTIVTDPPHKPDKCPECGGTHINLSGHDTKTGKQRFKCMDCGRKFVENPTQFKFKIQEKKCPNCGHVGAKRAGTSSGKKQYYLCLECGHKYLENPCYTHLTPRKKETIIKYGVGCGVPVKYLAEYLNCSERTVRNVLSPYKIKIRQRYQRSEQEKHQDFYVLDKFLGGK